MYSQNNEEEIICTELARVQLTTGNFLDIGAWDGKGFSNTYRLAELGWSGVCVEASPTVFPGLIKNHAGNAKIKLVNAAISAKTSTLVDWFDSGGDAISTTSPEHARKWEAGWKVKFTPFLVYTMPLSALFERFGYQFQLVNIDVESTNIDLFRALPWEQLKAHMHILCIEHDGHVNEMATVAAQHGYSVVALNGENLLLNRLGTP